MVSFLKPFPSQAGVRVQPHAPHEHLPGGLVNPVIHDKDRVHEPALAQPGVVVVVERVAPLHRVVRQVIVHVSQRLAVLLPEPDAVGEAAPVGKSFADWVQESDGVSRLAVSGRHRRSRRRVPR